MFKKTKDKAIDYSNLNSIIRTGNKLIKLFFYLSIGFQG